MKKYFLPFLAIFCIFNMNAFGRDIFSRVNIKWPANKTLIMGSLYQGGPTLIFDLNGKQIEKTKIQLTEGINEIMFEPNQSKGKMYIATLLVDDKIIETAKVYFR